MMIIKFINKIFSTSIRSENLNVLSQLIVFFLMEYLEHLEGYRIMFSQIKIYISTIMINKWDEVSFTLSHGRSKWSTYSKVN